MGIDSPNTRNVSVTCLGYPFGNSTVFNHRSLLHGEKNMIVGLWHQKRREYCPNVFDSLHNG